MQPVRDFLRDHLASALNAHSADERISAAWPVVCGAAIAQRTRVLSCVDGIVEIAVPDGAWLRQMLSLREKLLRELPTACGIALTDILFKVRPEVFAVEKFAAPKNL